MRLGLVGVGRIGRFMRRPCGSSPTWSFADVDRCGRGRSRTSWASSSLRRWTRCSLRGLDGLVIAAATDAHRR